MNKGRFHIGPGAASLMLIAVVLCMAVMGILSLVSARNDAVLSERSAAVVEEAYQLNSAAEVSLGKLADALQEAGGNADAAVLPEGMERTETGFSWTEKNGERTLHCQVKYENGSLIWTEHCLTAQLGDALSEE